VRDRLRANLAGGVRQAFDPTNSRTAGWSSKWPSLRVPSEIRPRITGMTALATARRTSVAAAGTLMPPKMALPRLFSANQAITLLTVSMVHL
jgi:hypothetical protein